MVVDKQSSDSSKSNSLTYRDAGVDIDAGDALIERIKPLAANTQTRFGSANIGGFGAAFKLDLKRWPNPVLISGTDGVGTKLKIAIETGIHNTIGIDLVAMCANDILVTGATPLFFLDYYATGKLQLDEAEAVIAGIAEGCTRAGLTLSGGETAEMPSMYDDGHYDLAGFAVGVVNEDAIIDGSKISDGQIIIGVDSNGVHSNGFSLVRHVMQHVGKRWQDSFNDEYDFGSVFLKPTALYCKPVLAILDAMPVHGMAHITGGGLPGNLPRVLPANTMAVIDRTSWQWPEEFQWLQQSGNITLSEMDRTFNLGIGFCLIIDADKERACLDLLKGYDLGARRIGHIESHDGTPSVRYV